MTTAGRNETKKFFRKNLRLLSPWIRESVLRIDEKELWKKVEITYNDEGLPVCRCHREGASFGITGRQPVREAELWGKTVLKQGTGCIFLYGSGFGYALFEIFARKRPHTLVVLFEQDIYLFAAMLHYFDLEPLLKTQKLVVFIGDPGFFAKAFDRFFFSIAFISCSFPTLAFTYGALRNFKREYSEIHKYVFSELSLFVFYLGNCHLDSLTGMENLLSNMGEIIRNPFIDCLKDKYADTPAFIIANGPSLDKNILQLKKIQGRGLILCAESAAIPLMKNGIKPDVLTVVERTGFTYTSHFKDIDYPGDVALLCLALVDKRVYPSFRGPKIPIFRRGEAINQWIGRYVGNGSSLDAGANVTHLAFELAVHMGADPIVFVGQDYAYGPEGATHSRDSVYFEAAGVQARKNVESKPVVYVEGNECAQLPSNQLWVDFRHGLERKIAAHPDKTVLNSTEGGAKIKGMECRRLARVIGEYCTRPLPYRVDELIEKSRAEVSAPERTRGLSELAASVANYSGLFRRLGRIAAEGKLECSRLLRLSLEKDSGKYRDILGKAYQKNINTYQLYIADDLVRCFSEQIIFVFYYLMDRLGVIDTPRKTAKIFRLQYNFFHYLNIVCQSVAVHLENAGESLGKLLEEQSGNEAEGRVSGR